MKKYAIKYKFNNGSAAVYNVTIFANSEKEAKNKLKNQHSSPLSVISCIEK